MYLLIPPVYLLLFEPTSAHARWIFRVYRPFSENASGFITPHVCDVSGVIVLTSSVCVSVCLLPLSQPNGQTYGLEFQYVGQVEGYLGQVCRSRSKVTRSQTFL